MKIVTIEEMKQIESKSLELGLNEALIIENIGRQGADKLEGFFKKESFHSEIVFLIGKGNNGADGLSIARHLENRGIKTRAFLLYPDEVPSSEVKKQAEMADVYGVRINEIRTADQLSLYFDQIQSNFILVDGILGSGQILPLSNYLFDINQLVNNSACLVFSIDMPTGICSNSGKMVSEAIRADYSLAIGLPKTGYYAGEGPKFCGEVLVLDGGISSNLLSECSNKNLLAPLSIINNLEERDRFGHKNSFGHCLVIGGTKGLTGALILASKAALKVGAGLVTAVTWEDNYFELTNRITPEIMTNTIPEEARQEILPSTLANYDSVVLGPGIGQTKKARELVEDILNTFTGTLVIDADAIKLLDLEKDSEMINSRKGPTVLTPHLKEFSDLAKMDMEDVVADPYRSLKEVVDKLNCAIVLKGACTFLALPEGEIFINYFPNDGLATGGSGDVLAGILGGILAGSHYDPSTTRIFENKSSVYDALAIGLSAHTLAGRVAASKLGVRSMSALDIIDNLSFVFDKEFNTREF